MFLIMERLHQIRIVQIIILFHIIERHFLRKYQIFGQIIVKNFFKRIKLSIRIYLRDYREFDDSPQVKGIQ